MKTLILFAYNERLSLYDGNLDFFLKFGVFESDFCDFCIIVSGPLKRSIVKTVKNMSVVERENKKGDFGAWGDALNKYDLTKYDKFIFINDTCRGPYVQGTCKVEMWPQLFLSKLDEKCKLVGPTKNSMIADHIQSCAFGCDSVALKILLDDGIFSPTLEYPQQKGEFIARHEVGMSRLVVSKGFTFEAFFKGDGVTPYFGSISMSPFEIMFIKTNVAMHFDKRQIESASPGWNSTPIPNISFQPKPTKPTNQLVVSSRDLKKK